MMATMVSSLILPLVIILGEAQLSPPHDKLELLPSAAEPVDVVLSSVSQPQCSVMFLLDGNYSSTIVFLELARLQLPWSAAVFQVAAEGQGMIQEHLSRVVGDARRLRQLSWCVTVVVVSDDPAFLAAFAQWSLKGRLLMWPTRLLALTHLPLQQLQHLQKLFSLSNAMLVITRNTLESLSCRMYVHLPFSPRGVQPLQVASWTPHRGLSLTTSLQLFPDKFEKFPHRPTIVAATEGNPLNKLAVEDDAEVPGGKRLTFSGPMPRLMTYLATALNFSYIYVRPADGTWGLKYANGSWSGMVGMVSREEADIGVGPFGVSGTRAEVVDFTLPIMIEYSRMLGARGRPEVDPWGFLLPLAPLVWAAILTTLLLLPAAMFLFSSYFFKSSGREKGVKDFFSFVRVLLQQGIIVAGNWWWERLVLGVWMMMTLVLTRSYAGNLMSLLAVRHIPQPYQTIGDFLDDPSVTMIWGSGSNIKLYLYSAATGKYRDLEELAQEDRVKFVKQQEFPKSIDTLVRRGDHVLTDANMALQIYLADDFARTGQCSFYKSSEEILPLMFAMIGQKDSPLIQSISMRIMVMTEAGLFRKWMQSGDSNSQICDHEPNKITIKTSLALRNLWGMFVILGGGYVASLCLLILELLVLLCTGLGPCKK